MASNQMLIPLVFFAIAALFPGEILGAVLPPKFANLAPNLKYIGASNSSTKVTSKYFLSENAAAWETAQQDCINSLGRTANLACPSTRSDLNNLYNFLDTDEIGSSYWIGGYYNTTTSAFNYVDGSPFPSSPPWDKNQPATTTSVTRVWLYTEHEQGFLFETEFNTYSFRYICQLPGS